MSDLTENKSHKRVLRFKKTALKDTLSSQPEENGGLNEPLVGEEVAIPFKRKKYSAKKKSDENVSNLFASSLSGLSDNEDTIEDNSLITQIYNDYSKEGDNSSDDLSIAEEEKGKEDKLETKSASDGAYEKKEEVKELEKIDEKVEDEKSSLDAQEEQFKHNYSSNRQNIQNNRSNNRQNSQNSRYSNRNNSQVRNSQSQQVEEEIDPNAPVLLINDLNGLELPMLREKAKDSGLPIEEVMDMKRQEIIVAIAKDHAAKGGSLNARGTLEVLQDGYGFLRSELNSYITGPEDIFTSPQLIRQYGLRTGDEILAHLKTPKQNERYFAVAKILSVNNDSPLKSRGRVPFDALTPVFPDELINMETVQKDDDVSMRLVNLFDPIGKGQRALITAPPRTGKTILLKKIANSITTNYPNIKLMVLLIDERPEEVTDMERSVKGEVIASTFDEQASRHVAVAEMVIEKAKRMVEYKQDVVILLDSITRLARAYNQTAPASGKVLSGGVDSNALHKPKRFFGAARNIENGGSLTIIASALIETGSRMDEVIFEEFKGTGNCELVLDRRLAEKRVFPALNLKKSGTRRDDLLLKKDEIDKIQLLRDSLSQAPKVQIDETFMTELVIDEMHKYNSNEEFFVGMMRESQIK